MNPNTTLIQFGQANYEDFTHRLETIATACGDGKIAVVTAQQTIEFRKVTFIGLMKRFFGCKGYRTAEIRQVLEDYLLRHQDHVVRYCTDANSVLARRRIAYIRIEVTEQCLSYHGVDKRAADTLQSNRVCAQGTALLQNVEKRQEIEKLKLEKQACYEKIKKARQERKDKKAAAEAAQISRKQQLFDQVGSMHGKLNTRLAGNAIAADESKRLIDLYNKRAAAPVELYLSDAVAVLPYSTKETRQCLRTGADASGQHVGIPRHNMSIQLNDGTQISLHREVLSHIESFQNPVTVYSVEEPVSADIINAFLDIQYNLIAPETFCRDHSVQESIALCFFAFKIGDERLGERLASHLLNSVNDENETTTLPELFALAVRVGDRPALCLPFIHFVHQCFLAPESILEQWRLFLVDQRGQPFAAACLGHYYTHPCFGGARDDEALSCLMEAYNGGQGQAPLSLVLLLEKLIYTSNVSEEKLKEWIEWRELCVERGLLQQNPLMYVYKVQLLDGYFTSRTNIHQTIGLIFDAALLGDPNSQEACLELLRVSKENDWPEVIDAQLAKLQGARGESALQFAQLANSAYPSRLRIGKNPIEEWQSLHVLAIRGNACAQYRFASDPPNGDLRNEAGSRWVKAGAHPWLKRAGDQGHLKALDECLEDLVRNQAEDELDSPEIRKAMDKYALYKALPQIER